MFDRVLNMPQYSNWLLQKEDDLIFIHENKHVLRKLDNSKVVTPVVEDRGFH